MVGRTAFLAGIISYLCFFLFAVPGQDRTIQIKGHIANRNLRKNKLLDSTHCVELKSISYKP